MKFTCSQAALAKAVGTVSKAVSIRTTIPILKGILMEVKGSKLKLTSSNVDLGIETYIDIQGGEDGGLVVSSRMLSDIIRRLPNAMVELSEGNSHTLQIKCLGSRFSLVGMPAEEYPQSQALLPIKSTKLSKTAFTELIRKTGFAASIDEKRGILIGCLLNFSFDSLEMAALDGFRMAVARTPIEDGTIEGKIVLPARILSDISKILAELEGEEIIDFSVDEKSAEILCDQTRITARLLSGDFISYKDIIPGEYKTRFVVGRDELIGSLERASLFAKEGKNNLVTMTVEEGKVKISSHSEEGLVDESLGAEISGISQQIGFNARFLTDALKAAEGDNVAFEMTSAVSSCLIKPEEGDSYTYLVVPVRIS